MTIPVRINIPPIQVQLAVFNTNETPSVTLAFAQYPFPQNTPGPVYDCVVSDPQTGLVASSTFTPKTVTINFVPNQQGVAFITIQMLYSVL